MLRFTVKGTTPAREGISRRGFLQVGSLGVAGLGLPEYLALKAQGTLVDPSDDRAAIMIFNLGGPSHLDTVDPKPEAPAEVRGPFAAIPTNVPEIQLSELLPRMARHADKFSLVRSCFHTAAAVHDTGHQLMQTGRLFQGGHELPHAGCVLSWLRGARRGLPAHVLLPEPMGRTGGNLPHGQGAGVLGKAHDPFALLADTGAAGDGQLASLADVPVQQGQNLRDALEEAITRFENGTDTRLTEPSFATAYQTISSSRVRAAFDLSQEPTSVRDRYGRNRFGQSCLLARRLVEAGVRFVTVNTFVTVFGEISWDIHGSEPFATMGDMRDVVAPMYDQAYSALLEDLVDRGMLSRTLVCNLAEFGRTPKINSFGGRDHWPQCWSVYLAGGGIQGGRVVGKSDQIGAAPAERPVTPAEVVATVYRSLGVDLQQQIQTPQGSTLAVVPTGVREIEELF